MFIGSWIRFFSSLARIGYSGLRPAVNEITRRRDITSHSIRLFTPKLVPVCISYIVYVVSKDFFEKGFIDEPNYVRSKFRQKLGGEKKKITRDAKLFRILIFRHNAFSVGCVACAHKLNAWVDKKFAIVETRPWKERVVNNGYTSMSRQRSGRHCQIGSFGSRF